MFAWIALALAAPSVRAADLEPRPWVLDAATAIKITEAVLASFITADDLPLEARLAGDRCLVCPPIRLPPPGGPISTDGGFTLVIDRMTAMVVVMEAWSRC